jgi:isochorismate synthase EntC
MALIRRLEPAGRGLYGGAVGWANGAGEGDLAVAIRCLFIAGSRVTAFAGAGIVAGSDPDAEVAEIELKLSAALRAL